MKHSDRDRIRTNVIGLDERIGGGVPEGSVVLVAGPSGSMKSTLVFNMLYNAVTVDKRKAMYISFEQSDDELKAQMRQLGMDADTANGLNIVDLSDFRKEIKQEEDTMDWMGSFVTLSDRYKKEEGCDIMAIDSLDALYSLLNMQNPRKQLFHFFRELKGLGMTTVLISEMPRESEAFGRYGVEEFLSDVIFHLQIRSVDMGRSTSVRRFIGVAKMRRSNHDMDYYPFLVTGNKMEIITE